MKVKRKVLNDNSINFTKRNKLRTRRKKKFVLSTTITSQDTAFVQLILLHLHTHFLLL